MGVDVDADRCDGRPGRGGDWLLPDVATVALFRWSTPVSTLCLLVVPSFQLQNVLSCYVEVEEYHASRTDRLLGAGRIFRPTKQKNDSVCGAFGLAGDWTAATCHSMRIAAQRC